MQKTLIDHIITNIPEKLIHQNVVLADEIGDHDLPCVILNIRKQKFEKRYKHIRNEKRFDLSKYQKDFSQIPMSVVNTFDDPNDQLYILNELTLSYINQHARLRRVKFTRPSAPWMTDLNIQVLQHKKDNQRLILKHSNKESDKQLYKDTKKQLKAEIKRTKKTFYQKALLSKNSKELWSTIHRILKPKPKRIKVDPKALNEYYSTLATKLTSNTNNNRDNLTSFINELPAHNALDSFTIQPTTHNEVSKILQNMRSDSSTGHGNIPIKFLKFVADDISLPLTNIINNSIQINVFPAHWKIGRICPIPKVRNPVQMKDYRPISILPAMSKVYEKVTLKQLSAFIKKMMLYKNTQSGYRKGHSRRLIMTISKKL